MSLIVEPLPLNHSDYLAHDQHSDNNTTGMINFVDVCSSIPENVPIDGLSNWECFSLILFCRFFSFFIYISFFLFAFTSASALFELLSSSLDIFN